MGTLQLECRDRRFKEERYFNVKERRDIQGFKLAKQLKENDCKTRGFLRDVDPWLENEDFKNNWSLVSSYGGGTGSGVDALSRTKAGKK